MTKAILTVLVTSVANAFEGRMIRDGRRKKLQREGETETLPEHTCVIEILHIGFRREMLTSYFHLAQARDPLSRF